MKTVEVGDTYFFVDESGDSTFYNAKGKCIVGEPGCSQILILGFIETQKPHEIRQAVLRAQRSIVTDPYLTGIPSTPKHTLPFMPRMMRQKFGICSTRK